MAGGACVGPRLSNRGDDVLSRRTLDFDKSEPLWAGFKPSQGSRGWELAVPRLGLLRVLGNVGKVSSNCFQRGLQIIVSVESGEDIVYGHLKITQSSSPLRSNNR